jgi:hypothetical protein
MKRYWLFRYLPHEGGGMNDLAGTFDGPEEAVRTIIKANGTIIPNDLLYHVYDSFTDKIVAQNDDCELPERLPLGVINRN